MSQLRVKHKATLRDSLNGIKDSVIRRLGYRAGVKFFSANVFDVIRGSLKGQLVSLVKDTVTILEYSRSKTIKVNHVKLALKMNGIDIGAVIPSGINKITKKKKQSKPKTTASKAKKSTVPTPKLPTSKAKKSPVTPSSGGIKKPHRFHPGTVSMRRIRMYQKTTGFLMSRVSFQRLVREIAQDFGQNIRFSKEAFAIIQLFAENFLVKLFRAALLITLNSNVTKPRLRVTNRDVTLARKIMLNEL